ncbi:MAG: hypothetical protein A3A08_02385 [Candidatus Nealsonbacteria bacterium RIFCSPLOWO2_01_FULL_41_9]|uniref:Uncharacterized protein n=1 Tax=Candidatus Nealsonbacteria bacterium RIFCSPLOWO2_01_FULL_41_9 TaxID=1801671 RepID=A0A1G2ECK1_9BACT|nr:MAG: hypothetical protein A3A08_02385 [Candidatus Nealsonbacteria bacterium RIFCSPLOWO2_01_FULL_41_9]
MNSELLEILAHLSGWLAAGFLFLNFFTCFAMPWTKKYRALLMKTEVPEEPKPLCFYHGKFTWITIFFVLVHIILGILVR